MTYFSDTFRIPLGYFSTAVDSTGALVATAFGTEENLRLRLAPRNVIPDFRPGAIACSPAREIRCENENPVAVEAALCRDIRSERPARGEQPPLPTSFMRSPGMPHCAPPLPRRAATNQDVQLINDASPGRHVREQVLAYWAGERRDFALPLAPGGTHFQQCVWAALQRIPFGETRSYGQLAAGLGNPAASRAVGRANATNPICLIVPCHRVIGADGSLTGFAFGEEIKRQLLEHERIIATRSRAA